MMTARLIAIYPDESSGRIETQDYGFLTIYKLPQTAEIGDEVEFDVALSKNGNYYAVYSEKKGVSDILGFTDKNDILRCRGFSECDIATNLAEYGGEWRITTITKDEVIAAQTAEELAPLFSKNSLDYSFTTTYYSDGFGYFAQPIRELAVSPTELDPYIARLIIAVNSIGVNTIMSCDGWHSYDTGRLYMYMRERYSVLWFWLIVEHIFGEKWDRKDPYNSSWYGKWEPSGTEFGSYSPRNIIFCQAYSGNEMSVYRKNYGYAVFIDKHRAELTSLRGELIDVIREKMQSGEIKNIDEMGFLEARRVMEGILLPKFEPLRRAYLNEGGK